MNNEQAVKYVSYDYVIKEIADNMSETINKMKDIVFNQLGLCEYLEKAEEKEKPAGSYDRTIEKMQKAIALHSIKKKPARKAGKRSEKEKEWLKRYEYNPFIHNAWFLLAKAEYMKGDFLSSAATFHYITRQYQHSRLLQFR